MYTNESDMRLKTAPTKRGNSQFGSVTFWCPSSLLAIAPNFFHRALCTLHAQTAELGDIQGTVIDRKLEKPLASHLVILTIHKADTVETQETTTDENGNYRFGDLPLDPSVHYTVSTVHEGHQTTPRKIWFCQLGLRISRLTLRSGRLQMTKCTSPCQVAYLHYWTSA